MVTFVALLEFAAIVWAITAWRQHRRAGRHVPRSPAASYWASPDSSGPTNAPIAGWLIGHQIAQGKSGIPGDPLPGGHLGSPADLAYWGGMDEDEDEDESSDQW
jgi:hypothetical protein